MEIRQLDHALLRVLARVLGGVKKGVCIHNALMKYPA